MFCSCSCCNYYCCFDIGGGCFLAYICFFLYDHNSCWCFLLDSLVWRCSIIYFRCLLLISSRCSSLGNFQKELERWLILVSYRHIFTKLVSPPKVDGRYQIFSFFIILHYCNLDIYPNDYGRSDTLLLFLIVIFRSEDRCPIVNGSSLRP